MAATSTATNKEKNIMRNHLLLFIALCLIPMGFATENVDSKPNKTTVSTGVAKSHDEVDSPTYWDFITCADTESECHWEADHHGYDHWKAVHGDPRCHGHMHYGCYGGHH